jgi:hypothetical protein
MSTVKSKNVQVGTDTTPSNNFTWYQPVTPDGTVRLGRGDAGSVTDIIGVTGAGNVGIGTNSPTGKLTISAAANEVSTFISTVDTNADLFLKATGTTLGNVRLRANANDMAFITGLAENARITSSGLMQFNSGYGSVATAYGCRAWVNFNGTGTPAIRGSGNVSSITDHGVGDYSINFSSAMPDANYSVSFITNDTSQTNTARLYTSAAPLSTSAFRVQVTNAAQSATVDVFTVCLQVFR